MISLASLWALPEAFGVTFPCQSLASHCSFEFVHKLLSHCNVLLWTQSICHTFIMKPSVSENLSLFKVLVHSSFFFSFSLQSFFKSMLLPLFLCCSGSESTGQGNISCAYAVTGDNQFFCSFPLLLCPIELYLDKNNVSKNF